MSANPVVGLRQVGSHIAVTDTQIPSAKYKRKSFPRIDMGQLAVEGPPVVSPWCMSPYKRIFDLACVLPALLLVSPVLLVVALLVKLTSRGPVFFRQERTGLHRRIFTIYKFRTMFHDREESGPCVTKCGDTRLTPVGAFLRKYKLDELPQLYNVLRGDMSLVGPRPKLPQHEHLEMHYRPGVTGAATLAFSNEERMLKDVPEGMLEEFHVSVVSPIKKMLDRQYQEQATFSSDFRLLVDTVLKRRPGLEIVDLLSDIKKDPKLTALWTMEEVGD
ncbi:MAG: sugar transferase [Acidobacteriaceae bacterium]